MALSPSEKATHSSIAKPALQPRIIKLLGEIKAEATQSFFAIVTPGTEKTALQEIEKVLHGGDLIEAVGGVHFNAKVSDVCSGQPDLKIVNRVLLRVDQFGARDFQKLYRKIKGLDWELWLKPGIQIHPRASSHRSRLRIKKGIEKTALEAFWDRIGVKQNGRRAKEDAIQPKADAIQPKAEKDLLVIVRIEDDICTVSFDLSGELLHKRGTRTDVGVAPLRETWASAILQQMWDYLGGHPFLASDFTQDWQWIEPMAGTGVFIREALATSKISNCDQDLKDRHACEPAREYAVDQLLQIKGSVEESDCRHLSSATVENQYLKNLKKVTIIDRKLTHLAELKAAQAIAGEPKVEFEFYQSDFEKFSIKSEGLKKQMARLVIANPPWGKRLKGRDAVNTKLKQEKFLGNIERVFSPRFTVSVMPDVVDAEKNLQLPSGWTELAPLLFRAGGLPVSARFFWAKRDNLAAKET